MHDVPAEGEHLHHVVLASEKQREEVFEKGDIDRQIQCSPMHLVVAFQERFY